MKKMAAGIMLGIWISAAVTGAALAADTAAGTREIAWKAEQADLKYPEMTDGSFLYRARVNSVIETEVKSFVNALQRENRDGRGVSGWMTWEEGIRSPEWTSFTLTETTYYEKAAHPSPYTKGFIFKGNGQRVTKKELTAMMPELTVENLNKEVLEQTKAKNIPLYQDFAGIKELPKEFYIGEDGWVHFIFQQYEIAPYSSGMIDIAMEGISLPSYGTDVF